MFCCVAFVRVMLGMLSIPEVGIPESVKLFVHKNEVAFPVNVIPTKLLGLQNSKLFTWSTNMLQGNTVTVTDSMDPIQPWVLIGVSKNKIDWSVKLLLTGKNEGMFPFPEFGKLDTCPT